MNNTSLQTVHNGKIDKTSRYGWTVEDTAGEFRHINKQALHVPVEYQRELIATKARDMASAWSWFGCGVIIVAYRDGVYWVVDGQHRVNAAMHRSDIAELPCLVFQSPGIVGEAKAFLTVNAGRKPVSAIGRLNALAVAEDPIAAFVVDTIRRLGLSIAKTATKKMEIKCIGACQKLAKDNPTRFLDALTLTAELSIVDGLPLSERVLSGLYYFDANIEGGLQNARLRKRIKDLGSNALLQSAGRAAAYFAAGGMKVWSGGMLSLVNKGLRNQFEFKGGPFSEGSAA